MRRPETIEVNPMSGYEINPYDDNAKEAYEKSFDLGCDSSFEDKGFVSSFGDSYFYQYHSYRLKFNGSGKANFYLNWEDNSSLHLYIYDESGLLIASSKGSEKKRNKAGDLFKLCHSVDVVQNQEYMMHVLETNVDGGRVNYDFEIKLYSTTSSYEYMVEEIGLDEEGVSLPSGYEFCNWGDRVLKRHYVGSDVAHLQRSLVKLECLNEDEVDGIFGRDTRTAVRNFQRDWHVLVDGKVGAKTRRIIQEAIDWKRYNSYLKKRAVIRAALEGSGIANACKVTLPSHVMDEEYEYGPFPAGPFSVTYKIGYDYDPTNSMIKVTTDGRTTSTKINISDKIDAVINDSGFDVNLKSFEDILTAIETEENSQIYVSKNFPNIKIDSKGFSFEGTNVTIGVKKALDVDLGGGNVVNAIVYEELKLEPKPQDYDSSTNTSRVCFSQSMPQPGSNISFKDLSGAMLIGLMVPLAYKIGTKLTGKIATGLAGFCVIPEKLWDKIKEIMKQDYQA
ncbi:peptidoglycan-binding domain-containing protein [Paramaledivibacter caminithermalis]|jgi:hypothetical protein|uniref:Putative peptidoglycan binding domain-containing protein n=1 Tax=Paramaledivibacter caminithermalis (strain DSM 15212 / CIP 107654 / DViRD3) TaxID=1121301 RepID=A0A1M6LMZ3_PARC5|nr:peptidoglycan-binding domain-containing protein [Paramaledivibacter caminithermalis]SHJ72492.1 Putative peptidoglycan binding domain-containing protein [Paramaledivibacter caminithermalis DSM 15212]